MNIDLNAIFKDIERDMDRREQEANAKRNHCLLGVARCSDHPWWKATGWRRLRRGRGRRLWMKMTHRALDRAAIKPWHEAS